jgi:ectoine hydroxylase-related dioxygenase (phytanoyl-CoA dioxygenase family)
MTRVDPTPGLDDEVAVDAACVAEFQSKGHTVVRGLASAAEVEAYRPLIHDATMEHAYDKRPLEERDTYGKAFLQAANLWRRSELVRRFTLSRRFGRVAADLLGVDGVRLYHDQALFKEAGGGRTPWHQDQHYWPLDTDRTITMWMPLVDVPASIGTMTFVSGSQRLGYLGEYSISDESDRAFEAMLASDDSLSLETHGPAAAGDATFHAGWMLHSAPPNPTGTLRAVMTVIYFPDGTRVTTQSGPAQEFDLKIWLRGLSPGDLAAGELNPLLWSRSS